VEVGSLIYGPPVFAQTSTTAPAKESAEGERLMGEAWAAEFLILTAARTGQ
jgi:hypothetical protein